jgi:multidrug resistance efflux pump
MTAQRREPPIAVRLGIFAIVAAVGLGAYSWFGRSRANDGRIQGSGTIEATQVSVAPKVAGRVVAIRAREGAGVAVGQVVAELDHDEIDAQVAQAEAAVAAAQARLAQAQAALSLQQLQARAAVDQAQAATEASRTRVPAAERAADVQASAVSAAIQQAQAQVDAATAQVSATEAGVRAAEAAVRSADAQLANVQADLARAESLHRDGAISAQQRDAVRTAVTTAGAQRDGAWAQQTAAEAQHSAARSAVAQARAALRTALANQQTVEIRRLDTAASRAQLEQAQAALRSAQAATGLVEQRARDVDAARAAVAQAQAALRLVQTARGNAIVRAPIAGVVVSRSVEVGDLVTTGTPIVTVADLDRVFLRIFVAETDLARVKVGQAVRVTVDAFRDRAFAGTVEEISDRAEFTPGNVQTREERTKLVFAVRVAMSNPDRTLKPGLPADAVIMTNNEKAP